MSYLHHYGYDNSVEVIKNETGIGANAVNYKALKKFINKKDFKNAIMLTKYYLYIYYYYLLII